MKIDSLCRLLFPLLAGVFFAGVSSAQTPTINSGPNFGSFPTGTMQLPLVATGGTGTGYVWSVTSGSLPPGLALRNDGFPKFFNGSGASAGIIGVATTTGTSNFTLQVKDSANSTSASVACTIKIISLNVTDSNNFPDGIVGIPYSFTPTVSGSNGAVTWALPPGNNLPAGLSLNTSTGAVTGTPSTANNYGFSLNATDSAGTIGRFFNIAIYGVGFSNSGDLGNFNLGSAVSINLNGVGGTAPYTFQAGNVPPGLTLSSAGLLSGTLTGGAGTYRFTVTVNDHNNAAFSKNFAINIIGVPSLPNLNYPNPPEDSTLGEPHTYSFNVNGGRGPYLWTVSGSLPPGMHLQTTNLPTYLGPNDAVIIGTPIGTGDFTFTINVKDSSTPNVTVSQAITLHVKSMTVDYPSNWPNATRGTAYSYYLRPIGGTQTGNPVGFTWSILSGSLPAGLTLDGNTGIVSGTPTENGSGSFSPLIRISGGGVTIDRYLGFNVNPPTSPAISINGQKQISDAILNTFYSHNFNACCTSSGVTFSIAGGPPAGLTLDPSGYLSGTPTAAGQYNLEVHAVDNGNGSNLGIRFFTLNVSPIQPNTPTPTATFNSPYSTTFTAPGATSWTLGPGSQLPPGMTFTNGTLSGTPSSPGSFNLNYIVSNGATTYNGYFGIQVYPAGAIPPPTFNFGSNVGTWQTGEIQYGLGAGGGNGTYSWALAGGALPTGIRLRTDLPSYFQANQQAGAIGVATTPGDYGFTLAVTSAGQTSYQYCTWRITAMNLKDGALPQAFAGVPFNYTLTPLNAANVTFFNIQGDGLPPGMSLSSGGVFTGTPSTPGQYNFNFQMSNGTDTITRFLSINVSAVRFTNVSAVLPNVQQNGIVNFTFTAAGGSGGYTFTPQGGLPGGLSLSAGGLLTGNIVGPVGRTSFAVKVTDSSSSSFTKTFSLDVLGAPPLLPSISLNNMLYSPITTIGMYTSRIVSVTNGGAAPFTWNVTGLPPGMSFHPYDQADRNDVTPGDIEIWGSPTALGDFAVTYTVTDADGLIASVTRNLTVSVLAVDGSDYLPNGAVGVAYSKALRVLGGTGPYTVTQIAPLSTVLPDGLTFNAGAMTVSGTPLEGGNFGANLQFNDSAGNSFVALNGFFVSAGNPSIQINQTFNLGNVGTGSGYSFQLNACCSASGLYTWSQTGGTMPPGLTISAGGLISGTPTSIGTYTFLIKAADTNNSSNAGFRQFVLNVTPISFSSSSNLPFGTANAPYNYAISTSGGTAPVTYVLAEGSTPLPPGITLSSSGVLSGTPTATGQFFFSVKVSDSASHTNTLYLTLPVYVSGPLVAITTGADLDRASIGVVQIPLTASGGNGNFTWSLTSGSLPPGLSIRSDKPGYFAGSASAGIIGVATSTGNYSFTLKATSGAQFASQAFTLKIVGLTNKENYGFRLPDAFVGSAYSYAMTPLNNNGTVTYSSPTGLPAGMSLGSDGVLSGTPSAAGYYNFSFTMTDSVDHIVAGGAISVNLVQSTSPGLLPNGTQGSAYSYALSASGGTGPYTFTATGLPNGVSLSSAGVLSGTVTAGPGRYYVNITSIDHNNVSYTRAFALVVTGVPPALPAISPYGNFDDCSYGVACSRGVGVVSGGTAPLTWLITGLPNGMSFRPGTGMTNGITAADVEVWGTPLALGTFNVTVKVTDADGKSATQVFPLTVSRLFLTDGLINGTRGVAYSSLQRVIGGSPAVGAPLYTASQTLPGTLPAGLSLTGMTVGGTPLENGNFSPQILFTDSSSNGLKVTEYFNIGGGSSTISATQYNLGSNGSTNDLIGVLPVGSGINFQLNACCANGYSWLQTGGTLPPGVSLSASGLLTGTMNTAGTYSFTVQVADSGNANNFGTRLYTIVVTPLNITTSSSLPFASVNQPYSQQLSSSSAATFTLLPGYFLPPGITLSNGGLLSGTPTVTGQYSFYVLASDANNSANQYFKSFNLSVYTDYPPLFLSTGPNLGPFNYSTRTQQLTATGGKAPYHYSFSPGAQAVPNFHVIDGGQMPASFPTSTTGGLVGVVATVGTYPTSLRVTDSNGSTYDRAITITTTSLEVLNPNNPPAATINAAYSYTFLGQGGTGIYNWTATGLPTGLTMGVNTGTIAGTPTVSGTFNFNVIITDSASTQLTFGYTLRVYAFAISNGQVLPTGTQSSPYTQTLTAPNCAGACTWSVVQGNLPGGLSLSSAGVLSGTPNSFYNNSFTVQVAGTNDTVQRVFGLRVQASTAQPLFIASGNNLFSTTIGTGFTSTLFVQGGTAPYTWSVANGSVLPPGIILAGPGETLGFNFQAGFTYLIGKPTQLGHFTFTLKVTDGAAKTVTQDYVWDITPLNFNMTTFPVTGSGGGTYGAATPTPTYGVAYSQQLLVIGGSGNYTSWTAPASSNPLPPGLTLNASTGLVSGTPGATGSFSTLIQVSDDGGNTHQQFVTFNVASPTGTSVNIGLTAVQTTASGQNPVVFNLNPSGGSGPYTLTALDALPPGCALLSGNALLANANGSYDLYCAALQTGTFTTTIKVTDSAGNIGVRQYTFHLLPQFLFTNTALTSASVNTPYSQYLLSWNNSGVVGWSVAPGSALPTGLSINGQTIEGTPTVAGNYSFVLVSTDSGTGEAGSFTFTLTVSPITITNPSILPTVAVYDTAYSYQFTANGGGSNRTWTGTGIPLGLTLSSSGLLSGTLRDTSALGNMVITVSDGAASVSKRIALYLRFPSPSIMTIPLTQGLLGDVRLGQGYSNTLASGGGVGPFTWSVAPGSTLPPGLALYAGSVIPGSFAPGSNLLAGQPSAVGHYTFDLIVTDSLGASARRTYTMNVVPVIIMPGGLPAGTMGTAYSRQLTAVGGNGPYTFTYSQLGINTIQLPPGVTASPSGLISGTPTSTGSYGFKATVTDHDGNTFTLNYTWQINNNFGVSINTPPIFNPFVGSTVPANNQPSVTQGSSYAWSVISGSLPPGIDLGQDGFLNGAFQTPGTYSYTLRAFDSGSGNSVVRDYTIHVSAMTLDYRQLTYTPPATEGSPYSYQFRVIGGTAPYTFSTHPLYPLPPGLSLSSSGLLSGTPTQSGAYGFYMHVTDSDGNDSYVFSTPNFQLATNFVVKAGQNLPLYSTNIQVQDGSVGLPYALSLGQGLVGGGLTGGVAPFTWSVAAGSNLPPGMAILPGANGVSDYLGGIPTTVGNYTVTLQATDAVGQTALVQHYVNISPLSVTPRLFPNLVVGAPFSLQIGFSGGTAPYNAEGTTGYSMPTGIAFSNTYLASGTPTSPGLFDLHFSLADASNPQKIMNMGRWVGVVDKAGMAQGLSISPGEAIQISYTRTGPAPNPVPLDFTATTGTIPFTAMVSGIPGATLSATTGTAPASLTLNIDTNNINKGVYAGVVAAYAPTVTSGFVAVPVVLTVLDPPPCTYTLVPTGSTIAAAGGNGSFTVSTGSLCTWTATTADAFVTITPATASGTGPGTVQYSLSGNGGLESRTGTITVGGQQFSVTQFGSSCALALTPNNVTVNYGGGLATVNVTTTNSACAWTASGLGASPTSGSGNHTVTFTIPPTANVGTQTLTASVQLNGGAASTFTATQTGVSCTVSLSALNAGAGYSGGDGSLTVSTPAGCSYTTLTGPSWLTVTSGGSGNGPGPVTLTYSVAANSTTVPRSGALTIGDQSFTITQDPTPCSVTVDTTNSGSPFAVGGSGGVLGIVANGANCTWTASSPVPWATLSKSFGTGNDTITVNTTSNSLSTLSRSANLTVAGQSVAITQGGTVCNYNLGSTDSTVPFGGGTGSVTVTAPAACSWSSATDGAAPWLSISSSGSGGTSNVVFAAAPNGTASARSGTLTIAGQAFTVTEAAGPCNYILSGTTSTLAAAASGGLFTFSTGTAGCSATAISFASWLTASTSSAADGTSGTVNFTALDNPSGTTRTGTIQFAGQTYTVKQTGASCAYSLNSYGMAFTKTGGGGNVLGSATAPGCTPSTSTDQNTIVLLQTLVGPTGGIFTLPFSVVPYNSAVTGTRRMTITFGGQLYTVKQTSW